MVAMKILILTNSQLGLYKFRKELLETMVAGKYKVYVSVPEDEFTQELKDIGVRLIHNTYMDRRGTNPIHDLKLLNYYQYLMRKITPDVVLTYTIKPNVYGGFLCGMMGIPYIANITGLGTSVENDGIMRRITTILYKFGLRKAEKVFFQNTENRDFMLRHHIVRSRYDILPGSGVNLKQYHVLDYPSGENINFVFIARIMKEKGIEQYLEAAEYIRGKYSNTQFHVCGICEQDYKEKLEQFQRRNIINYHGMMNDIIEIHKISSCTIHPTYYPEGLSNVLLESAACGRPIIATNRSGCREIIEDGINGFIISQNSSKDLINKIEKFLKLSVDERKKMGLAGRKKVEKEFDRQIVIDKYLRELQQIKNN